MLPPILLDWRSLLKDQTRKPYYRAIDVFLEKEHAGGGWSCRPARTSSTVSAVAGPEYRSECLHPGVLFREGRHVGPMIHERHRAGTVLEDS